MRNIIICDQDEAFTEQIRKILFDFYDSRNFETNIHVFPNGSTLMSDLPKALDLILLNTRPDGRMDYTIVKSLRDRYPKVQVFFLSDHDEDVFEAVNCHPFCYIRKKNWQKELHDALNRLWETSHKGHYLQIKLKRRIIAIMIDDIMYLESSGHYVVFHCTNQTYRTREKLPVFIEKLQGQYFVQPSKSYLVNCDYIARCTDVFLLKNGEVIICTKTRYRATIDFYEKYIREMHAEG